MPWRPTAAIEAGVRGLAERVSRRPFGSCMFFAHQRQPTNGCRRVYRLASASAAAGTSACMTCMTCMVPTVSTVHFRQAQVHLTRLPLSAIQVSLYIVKLLLHRHPSGATQNISNVPEIQENTKKVARTKSGTVAMKI